MISGDLPWFGEPRLSMTGHFGRYGEIKGTFTCLAPFAATAAGLKPAMDDWVPVERLDAYLAMLRDFGLHSYVDCYFQPITSPAELIGVSGAGHLTTTRSRALPPSIRPSNGEAHIFLSRDRHHLDEAVGTGWYQLIVANQVILKPHIDFVYMGYSLGYPRCCVERFAEENNWYNGSSYYFALTRSNGLVTSLCNTLAKHTPYAYVNYIPCSFSCEPTMASAAAVRSILKDEDPGLTAAIDIFLQRPFLHLSEIELYVFDGTSDRDDRVRYRAWQRLPPTEANTKLAQLLSRGDELTIESNLIRVFKRGVTVGLYAARGDVRLPQAPFIFAGTADLSP